MSEFPTIGQRGRRRRLRLGVLALVGAGVMGAALLLSGTPRVWRWTAIVPLWVGWLGVLQARDKT